MQKGRLRVEVEVEVSGCLGEGGALPLLDAGAQREHQLQRLLGDAADELTAARAGVLPQSPVQRPVSRQAAGPPGQLK